MDPKTTTDLDSKVTTGQTDFGTPVSSTPVTDKATRSAHDAIDRAAETAAQAEQRLRDTAHQSEDRLRQAGTDVQQASEQAYETARSYINQHPLESVGIAFVSGVVVASLLRR